MSNNTFTPAGRPQPSQTMTTPQATPAGRADGTGTRAEATRRERRFRADTSENADLKLSVPEHLKKLGFTYRWVNDTIGGRVDAMHARDWDVVSDPKIAGTGEGTPVKRSVEQNAPLKAVLMEKPEDWHKQDQERKNADRKQVEETMKRGPLPDSQGLQPNEAYVPQGHRNTIGQS